MQIKAITFDVGGTLVEGKLHQKEYFQCLLDYLRSLGYHVPERNFRASVRGMIARLQDIRRDHREGNFRELYSGLLDDLGVEPRDDVLEEIKEIYYANFPQVEIRGVREMLRRFHERFKLGVISNAMTEVSRVFLRRSELSKFFDVIVLSSDVGIRKPDPRIFHYALEKLNVEPGFAVHVGNSLIHDIAGAKGAGMMAIWVARERAEALGEPDYIMRSILDLPKVMEALTHSIT